MQAARAALNNAADHPAHRARLGMALALAMFVGLGGATHAYAAAACDAPWMHVGGGFELTATPSQHVTKFSVSSFKKTDAENCSGTVRTTATMTFAGHSGQSASTVTFNIAGGKGRLQAESAQGTLHGSSGMGAMTATMSARTPDLLSYVGEITSDGQRLPATHSEVSMVAAMTSMGAAVGRITAPKVIMSTSAKQVGKQTQLSTAAGRQTCWPVSYDQTEHADHMMAMGRAVNLDSTAHVVDYFCPATGLVMRKDLTTNGKRASQVVSAIH